MHLAGVVVANVSGEVVWVASDGAKLSVDLILSNSCYNLAEQLGPNTLAVIRNHVFDA